MEHSHPATDSSCLIHSTNGMVHPYPKPTFIPKFLLVDLFWVVSLVGCIVGAVTTEYAEIAWIGVACLLFFFWNRPFMLRFWTIAMVGIGTALWIAGAHHNNVLLMRDDALIAWGVTMIAGACLAFVLFELIPPKAPPKNPPDSVA
jgi:hypothetical protein